MATDWTALELEFVNGSMTLEELADKHGLKSATVRQRAKRHTWQEKRHALSQAVTGAAQEVLAEKRIDALSELNRKDLELAEKIRAKADEMLQAASSPNELRAIAGAHDIAQKVSRLALGATTSNSGVSAPDGGPVQHEEIGAGFGALAALMAAGKAEAEKKA